jgi:anti-sigma regulatory factor (Ser/Thr protein kinase)
MDAHIHDPTTQQQTARPGSDRLRGRPGAVSVELDAGPEAAAWARNALFAVEQGVDEDLMSDVRLLVSELVTNSVRHSGATARDSVGLDVAVDATTIRVEVSDPGGGFESTPRDASRTTPGGWGLYLVDRLADRWGVARNQFTRVWFEIDLASPRPA